MNRTQMTRKRNQAVYSLLANLSIAVENLCQDVYTDNDKRAIALIAPLVSARIDISQANYWLSEHPEQFVAPKRKERMSEVPRDFANRSIEKGRFKTAIETVRPELAGMKKLG